MSEIGEDGDGVGGLRGRRWAELSRGWGRCGIFGYASSLCAVRYYKFIIKIIMFVSKINICAKIKIIMFV